jgi:DnaJ-domain-containing protein 1
MAIIEKWYMYAIAIVRYYISTLPLPLGNRVYAILVLLMLFVVYYIIRKIPYFIYRIIMLANGMLLYRVIIGQWAVVKYPVDAPLYLKGAVLMANIALDATVIFVTSSIIFRVLLKKLVEMDYDAIDVKKIKRIPYLVVWIVSISVIHFAYYSEILRRTYFEIHYIDQVYALLISILIIAVILLWLLSLLRKLGKKIINIMTKLIQILGNKVKKIMMFKVITKAQLEALKSEVERKEVLIREQEKYYAQKSSVMYMEYEQEMQNYKHKILQISKEMEEMQDKIDMMEKNQIRREKELAIWNQMKDICRKITYMRYDDESEEKYYGTILGLRGKVTYRDIEKQYRKLIKENHPDRMQKLSAKIIALANHNTALINEAYNYFMNLGKKSK